MKLLCWNISHRTKEKTIHPVVFELVEFEKPDILILNEFVDGSSRSKLKSSLADCGLLHQQVSTKIGKHNQILIAARSPISPLALRSDAPNDVIKANLQLFDCGTLRIFAFRVPDFKQISLKREAWSYYLSEIDTQSPDLVIGDFNVGLTSKDQSLPLGLFNLGFLRADIPGFSYWTLAGAGTSIDHAFYRNIQVTDARYITEFKCKRIVGISAAFLSDHAPIALSLVSNRQSL